MTSSYRTYLRSALILCAVAACAACRRPDAATEDLLIQQAAMEKRLGRMEQKLAQLAGQVNARPTPVPLADRPATVTPTNTPTDVSLLLEQIEELVDRRTRQILETRMGTQEDIEAVFEEVVSEELAAAEKRREEARAAEREKRRQEWEERRRKRDEERLNELAVELALNDWQKERVAEVETRTREQVRASMTRMREAGSFDMDAFRTTAAGLRETNNLAVAEFLTDDQLKAYKERQENEFGFMWRGRRGSTP